MLFCGNECSIKDLTLDENGKGMLTLPQFGSQYASITLMPFAAGKTHGFNSGRVSVIPYKLKIAILTPPSSTSGSNSNSSSVDDSELLARLAEQVSYLKSEIARLQAILAARLQTVAVAGTAIATNSYSCVAITTDLYYGVENYYQVKCLQEFLKAQGNAILSARSNYWQFFH